MYKGNENTKCILKIGNSNVEENEGNWREFREEEGVTREQSN